jgi:hypothetical protein
VWGALQISPRCLTGGGRAWRATRNTRDQSADHSGANGGKAKCDDARVIGGRCAKRVDYTLVTTTAHTPRGRLTTRGVGHNLPQEAPQAFADAIIEVDGY